MSKKSMKHAPKPPAKTRAVKGKTQPTATPASGQLSRFQRFEARRVHRRDIKGAEYNPRLIDDFAKAKLKKKLETRGLLNALVWNEKTGNLVSGHQRLSILDALEGRDDYLLDVNVVRLSPKQEREENVFFNNPDVQGYFDPDKLGELFADVDLGISLDQTGFEKIAVEDILAGTDYADLFADPIPEATQQAVDELGEMTEARKQEQAARKLAKDIAQADDAAEPPTDDSPADEPKTLANGEVIRDPEAHARIIAEREKSRDKIKAGVGNADTETFLVVSCRSREEREEVALAFGKPPDTRYVDGREVLAKLGVDFEQKD